MRILLDPSRDGCTIWFLNRNTVKFLNGLATDICKRIYDFSTYYNDEEKQRYQYVDIILDYKGGWYDI